MSPPTRILLTLQPSSTRTAPSHPVSDTWRAPWSLWMHLVMHFKNR